MVKNESCEVVSDHDEIYSILNGKYFQYSNAAVTKNNHVYVLAVLWSNEQVKFFSFSASKATVKTKNVLKNLI